MLASACIEGIEKMPHSNIHPEVRRRARSLRSEMTLAETVMWDMLRDFRPRGARFRRETPVGNWVVDFAWLSKKIVIEVDGDSHETRQGRARDQVRDRWLRQQGYTVLRFDNGDVVEAREAVFLEIEQAIGSHLSDA
jgi:very-short-patch-repair endonuclease